MHHWPGPGSWLSRVTREPDTWNSGSGNFLEENSFFFCLDVYPLPKITATSWQQRVFLCLLHSEVAKSFGTPHCVCDLLHLCWESVLSLQGSAVCFSGVADIYPHVARALSLPAQNWMFQQSSSGPSVWLSPEMTMRFASRWSLSTLAAPSPRKSDMWWQRTHHHFMPGRFSLCANLHWNWHLRPRKLHNSCSCWLVWFWSA